MAHHRSATCDEPGQPERPRPASPFNALALPAAYSGLSLGILLIALAYAGARTAVAETIPLFWAGQLLLFGSVAAVALARDQSAASRFSVVLAFNFAQYVVKWMYSPLRPKFSDELQHERTVLGILETNRLFPHNYSLPISPRYPGLHSVAVSLVDLTGVGVHPAEFIVGAVAHMLLAAAVLVLLRQVAPDRVAAAVALIYFFSSHHAFYNSMYLYQTFALPLLVLLAVQLLAIFRGDRRPGRLIATALLSLSVTVTHHIAALAACVLLLGFAGVAVTRRSGRSSVAVLVVLAVIQLSAVAAWTLFVAPETLDYLGRTARELVESFTLGGAHTPAPGAGQPLVERAFTVSSVLLPPVVLPILAVIAWRRGKVVLSALALCSLLLHTTLIIVRLTAGNGEEVSGRAQNFSWLFIAAIIAAGWILMPSGFRPRMRALAGFLLALLFVGGITSGWPPVWERLPGQHQVGGFEAAIDAHAVAVSNWTVTTLPSGNRFAADYGNLSIIGTLGDQNPVQAGSDLFYSPTFIPGDAAIAQRNGIQFLLVDRRLAEELPSPLSGSYFANDSLAGRHTHPVDRVGLEKFRFMPDVACVYDDGTLRIYDLRRSRYA